MRSTYRRLALLAAGLALLIVPSIASANGPWVWATQTLKFRNWGVAATYPNKVSLGSGSSFAVARSYIDSSYTSHSAGTLSATDLTGIRDTTAWYSMPADWYPYAVPQGTSTDTRTGLSTDSTLVARLELVPDGSNYASSLVASMDTVTVTVQYTWDDDPGNPTVASSTAYVYTGATNILSSKAWVRTFYTTAYATANASAANIGAIMAQQARWRVIIQSDFTGRYALRLKYPSVGNLVGTPLQSAPVTGAKR